MMRRLRRKRIIRRRSQRGTCCETTKDVEAMVEGVSVLHEEPLNLNEFGEKFWSKYTLHEAADLKFCESSIANECSGSL